MAKDKSLNPVAAHAKAQKKAEHKKTKATVQKQRTERLAKRNPARLEKQIQELNALESSGSLKPRDQELLKTLERDLGQVRRARQDAGLGDEDERRRGPRGEQEERRAGAGKRRREDTRDGEETGSETDPEVRAIPMPRDTPPPVPRRRPKEVETKEERPAQITYSSAPVLKDLRKEATARFAPGQVRRNMDRAKGKGGLVEEEEWERLDRAGYVGSGKGEGKEGEGDAGGVEGVEKSKAVMMEEVQDEDL